MESRVCRALIFGVVLLAARSEAWAASCKPLLAERPALYEAAIALHSGERAVRLVPLPARARIMIFAREKDLDVALDVRLGGKRVGRADSAIRRHAIQRVAFTSAEPAEYTIAVEAKNNSGSDDSVSVRIVSAPEVTADEPCLAVERTLAVADQTYAQAHEAATPGRPSAPTNAAALNTLAARTYHDAAMMLARSGPSLLLAQALHAEAAVFDNDVRDWDLAYARAQEAAAAYAAVDDPYDRARAEAVGAEARLEIASAPRKSGTGEAQSAGMFAEVREQLARLAAFHLARGERFDEGLALNNIAISHHLQGSYDDALRAYRRALAAFTQGNEQSGEAMVLQNVALVEYELGRLSEAVPHYQKVLELLREEDDARIFSVMLNNSALANWASGNFDSALHQFNDVLRIVKVMQDPLVEAAALHNTGAVYDSLGDHARALDLYRQALALRTPQLDPRGRTASLRVIGNILRQQGKAEDALKLHQEALSLATARPLRARIQVQIAKDLSALGRPDQAREQLELVLAEASPGDEVTRARALAERSLYFGAQGDAVRAEADIQAAQRLFHKYEAPEDEFEAWLTLARLVHARGATDKAFVALDQALALAEEVRLQSANPELRATLLQPLRPAFDLKIALLADRYFAAGTSAAERERAALSAWLTAEQARSRALEDFQTFDVTAPGVPAELVARRRDIYRELAARRSRLATVLDRAGTEDGRVRAIRADIAGLRQQLDEIDARIGAASGRARPAASATSAPLPFESLPRNVAVVEYWLGGENAYAWVATRDGLAMSRLGSSAEITSVARAYHEALRGFGVIRESQRLSLGERLNDLVLKPLGPRVLEQRTLVFALDGALHYVPFATLRTRGADRVRFLVEDHDIAATPSIGMYLRSPARHGRPAPVREMLLVADPVYELGDARFGTAANRAPVQQKSTRIPAMFLVRGADTGETLSRLPATAREAATIAELLPQGSVDRLEGFTATRDRFLGAGLERYRFIHIASHAVNDAEIPQASALVLSTVDERSQAQDGRVLAADFVNVQLNAESVVLSACDTALGKSIEGEGLIGLQYVVLARGADSVVSSLWPVLDQASAQLMSDFYASRLRGKASLSTALGAAMRAMLGGRFKDPGVWGAFTLTVAHGGAS